MPAWRLGVESHEVLPGPGFMSKGTHKYPGIGRAFQTSGRSGRSDPERPKPGEGTEWGL